MSFAAPILPLRSEHARALGGLYAPWRAEKFPAPRLLFLNASLAAELGLDVERLASPAGLEAMLGQVVPESATPLAMAYAGHQFGNYSPRLGDGRALLLGELVDRTGRLRDVHLKGSGPTPYARGGDGKAAIGPMLREYLMGEAMHALGVPTTRGLGVIATGERIDRERPLPGAVLVRVAASHLRVGHFEYAAAKGDPALLRRLVDHAIARHHPTAARAENPALAFFAEVAAAQAELVARWMQIGFIHGVMNTDNTTISGETIDYGPCAFMDRHDPRTVFSSIDHAGRYAYGNQPGILQWNLARFAEALLPLLDPDTERAVGLATGVLEAFADRYHSAWRRGLATKLGIGTGLGRPSASASDSAADSASALAPDLEPGLVPHEQRALVDGVAPLLESGRVDHTLFFRRLSDAVRGDDGPARSLFADPSAFDAWAPAWRAMLPVDPRARGALADAMDRVNPLYIPRNHLVEAALEAATEGDLAPFETLLAAVTRPFGARSGFDRFAEPAPADAPPHRTYCGT